MTFGEPGFFWCLLVLPLLAGLIVHNDRQRQKRLEQLVARRLLPHLTDQVARVRQLNKRILYVGALVAFILALARPQMGSVEQNFEQHGRDIALAIDTSKSMLSTDYAPNRLARAKLAAQDILEAMRGDRLALIAFAGAAQVEAPLTVDYQTVLDAITQLNTNTVERGGTDISSAVQSAELALGKSEGFYRALVLLTDGEDLEEDAVTAAKQAASNGIRIFTVGIGTKEGSTIPLESDRRALVRDRNGQTIRSRLDESRLKEIAAQTGGFYVHLENGSTAQLISGLRKLSEGKIDERSSRVPIERYRWPLTIGLLLLLISAALSNRRKEGRTQRVPAGSAVVITTLALIVNGQANSGLDRYDQGDFDGALGMFRKELKHDPDSPAINFNLGDAAFRLQKYDEAFEAYSKAMMSSEPALQEKAYYNAGNTLFLEGNHAQDLEQQLSAYYDARYQYHQALDRNPGDEQAKKNLSLLEERIKAVERQKEEQQQRQRTQRRQSPRQHKERNRNKPQQGQMGQKPDQQSEPGGGQAGPDDPQAPGAQRDGSSDPDGNPADDMPRDEAPPSPKKDGQLREITPPDEEKPVASPPEETRPGVMSEDEALGLLDSLRDESDRIDLMHRKTDRGIPRDW